MKQFLPAVGLFALAAILLVVVYLPRFRTGAEEDLLLNDAAILSFGQQLERAVQTDSSDWLAKVTVGLPRQEVLAMPGSALPDADARRQRRIEGWVYWSSLYRQFGHFDLLRQYRDEAGPHLVYRAFDGEKPVYTDLLLGQEDEDLILVDWTEHPGSLSEQERAEAFQELAATIGTDALRQTIEVLVDAVWQAEGGRAGEALQAIRALPEACRANALVVGDELRIMADVGDPAFPQAVLSKGGLLSPAAVAHLAFSWSLRAGDAEGLIRSTQDLRTQFGEDSLLILFEGLAAEWAGDCTGAEQRFEAVYRQYPANPVLPVYALTCMAKRDPVVALERLIEILPGTGFSLDELDEWLALEVPALHSSLAYRNWRVGAPQTF
ncbi:MAG: hypothetical protein GC205_05385 [Bacteroidetes bacterium]|nr:hypothetical protein [Bacteroidota bacterium]